MSKTRTGKKHSEITKERIGLEHKGKKITDEHKKQTSYGIRKCLKPEYKKRVDEALNSLNLEVMPMYIHYIYDKSRGDGFRVSHPGYKKKSLCQKN